MKIEPVLKILEKTQGKTMLAEMTDGYTDFQMLISTILSARAKDEVTMPVSDELFKRYGTAKKLARAKIGDVKTIIKPIGFYNVKAKNIIEAAKMIKKEFSGKVPDTMTELVRLPGVGRKVGNCILVYAHGIRAIPVDTHVHRITNRLGWVRTKTPEKTETELEKIVPKKYWLILNDVFVNHGKTICTPQSPWCSKCPIHKYCERNGVKTNR